MATAPKSPGLGFKNIHHQRKLFFSAMHFSLVGWAEPTPALGLELCRSRPSPGHPEDRNSESLGVVGTLVLTHTVGQKPQLQDTSPQGAFLTHDAPAEGKGKSKSTGRACAKMRIRLATQDDRIMSHLCVHSVSGPLYIPLSSPRFSFVPSS